MFSFKKKAEMPPPGEALSGRAEKMVVPESHFVNGHPLEPPFPEGMEMAMFGLGCRSRRLPLLLLGGDRYRIPSEESAVS